MPTTREQREKSDGKAYPNSKNLLGLHANARHLVGELNVHLLTKEETIR